VIDRTGIHPLPLLGLLCLILYLPGSLPFPRSIRVTGFDYSAGGKRLVLTLYELVPG
jgi:hypothetical protein